MTQNKPKYPATFFLGFAPQRMSAAAARFFRMEAAGGILLVIAAAAALVVANSPLSGIYDTALNSDALFGTSILHWINDGLMAVFFLLVGLEIKREFVAGSLKGLSNAALPAIAAVGGMIVPALVYVLINRDTPENLRGWAIPCATDIAFALGILSLLGNRVPVSVKILLTAIAIVDDLGAILIVAFFYTDSVNVPYLLYALVPVLGLLALNRYGVVSRAPYLMLGVLLWFCVLTSGVHATMAGVLTALFVPLASGHAEERRSPLRRMEHDLHPWVAFLILPLFAFANAGVSFSGLGMPQILDPLTLGIVLGLVAGKQAGVFLALWLAIKTGLCVKPRDANWTQIYALSILCGVGFTMSLFIGGLAFTDAAQQAEIRLGVLAGSLISAVAAYMLFRSTIKDASHP